jgi:hypothetical protein
MILKKIFFLLILNNLIIFSNNLNIVEDSLINQNDYKWIISNLNEYEVKKKNEFTKKEIDSVLYSIAKKLENVGYPFAVIEFKYDSIINKNIYGKIFCKKGRLSSIDSVAIKGYNKFPKYLIERTLDLKKNEPYSQKKINNISKKVSENNFINEFKENNVLFNKQKTILFLYLEKKNYNSIDGFLGYNNENEKNELYGKINLKLINSFNLWEKIELNWNKMSDRNQELLINLSFPYFLNSIFYLETNFKILQLYNSYISRKINYNLEIRKVNNYFKFGYINKTSTSLTNNNNLIKDYKSNLLLFNWTFLKNNFFKKNIDLKINNEYTIGENKNFNQKQFRQQINFKLKLKLPVLKNNFIYLSSENNHIFGYEILENEKIGIGGISSLRGYIENSFFSKSFNILNIENKYFYNNNSYISFFCDLGKLYDLNTNIASYGFGIGFDMEKDVFIINYAVPTYSNSLDFNNSKIHFNYVLKF